MITTDLLAAPPKMLNTWT